VSAINQYNRSRFCENEVPKIGDQTFFGKGRRETNFLQKNGFPAQIFKKSLSSRINNNDRAIDFFLP